MHSVYGRDWVLEGDLATSAHPCSYSDKLVEQIPTSIFWFLANPVRPMFASQKGDTAFVNICNKR